MKSISLIRYAVSYVFIISGFMKLVSAQLAGSFLKLGLPFPDVMLKVVIFLEIVCGVLILVDRWVKNAAIPLIAIMIAALLLTKIPLIQTGGFLTFAFQARLDVVMLLLLSFLYKRYP